MLFNGPNLLLKHKNQFKSALLGKEEATDCLAQWVMHYIIGSHYLQRQIGQKLNEKLWIV